MDETESAAPRRSFESPQIVIRRPTVSRKRLPAQSSCSVDVPGHCPSLTPANSVIIDDEWEEEVLEVAVEEEKAPTAVDRSTSIDSIVIGVDPNSRLAQAHLILAAQDACLHASQSA